MKRILTLIAAILSSSISYGSVYVGNGGDGALIDGKVCVTEFIENGKCKDIFIGDIYSQQTLSILKSNHRLEGIKIDFILLAQKLNDIYNISPELHRRLLFLLNSYRWEFVVFDFWWEGSFIHLAYRIQNSVYISEADWYKLSPHQQIALLTHELLSGMLKPLNADSDPGIVSVSKKDLFALNLSFYDFQYPTEANKEIGSILDINQVDCELRFKKFNFWFGEQLQLGCK